MSETAEPIPAPKKVLPTRPAWALADTSDSESLQSEIAGALATVIRERTEALIVLPSPMLFGEYARRAETRREHVLELQRLLRLRSFGLADWRACLRVGAEAAWATDRGEPIVEAMLAHLRANGVLLPAAAVLERIGLAARARARKKTFDTLAAGLSDSERDTLTGLLAVDPQLRRSRFAWLRDYSESPAPPTSSRCWIVSNMRAGWESTPRAPEVSTPPVSPG